MGNMTEDEKGRLFATLDAQTNQLRRLEMGMYGDEKLGHKGLVKDMEYVLRWITKSKVKIAWVSGFCTAIGFGIKGLWDWITRK